MSIKSLPLWNTVADPDESHEILKLIIDIQTSNQKHLFDLALQRLSANASFPP